MKTAVLDFGWEYNTLDDPMYPMSGRRLKGVIGGEWQDATFIPAGVETDKVNYRRHYRLQAEFEWRRYFPLASRVHLGGYARALATLGPLYQTYTAELIGAPAFSPIPSTSDYFNPGLRAYNFVAAGINPVWNPIDKFQVRGDFYGFLPVRNIECGADGMARHGSWFNHPAFIGEVAAVYNLPFASLSLYGNYLSTPHGNWHFGISFGLFFLAPRLTR